MLLSEEKISGFVKCLNPPRGFEYGKIKIAAKYLIDEFGHEWALKKTHDSMDKQIEVISFRRQIKGLVAKNNPHHTNNYQTYGRLFQYANEIAVKREADALIKRLKLQVISSPGEPLYQQDRLMSYRYLAPLLALGLVGCSNPATDFDICRNDSKKTVLLVDLKRDLRALALGEFEEEIEENLVLLCMKARQWVWHPDKAANYSTLDPKSYRRR